MIAAAPEELKQSGEADPKVEDKVPENVAQVGVSTGYKLKSEVFKLNTGLPLLSVIPIFYR